MKGVGMEVQQSFLMDEVSGQLSVRRWVMLGPSGAGEGLASS